jgi:hypothetical protein
MYVISCSSNGCLSCSALPWLSLSVADGQAELSTIVGCFSKPEFFFGLFTINVCLLVEIVIGSSNDIAIANNNSETRLQNKCF